MIHEPYLLLAVAAAQALLLGFVTSEMARESGPNGVKTVSVLSAVISFVLAIVLSPANLIILGVLAFTVPTVLFSWWYGEKIVAAGVRKQLELAPQVVQFGLRYFDRYADKNGISSAALHIALDEGDQFTDSERELLTHMARRISDIGHVVDMVVVAGGGMHGVAAMPVYAISREDLRSYQARLARRYSRWMKA